MGVETTGATDTMDATADCPHIPQQSVHETVQCSATASEQDATINDCPEDPNQLGSAKLSNDMQLDATPDKKRVKGLEPSTFSLGSYRHRMEVPHEQQPTGGSANACTNACTDDTYSSKSEAAGNATYHAHMPAGVPPDLQRVIDAWPALPTAVRQGLRRIIETIATPS